MSSKREESCVKDLGLERLIRRCHVNAKLSAGADLSSSSPVTLGILVSCCDIAGLVTHTIVRQS